MAKRPIIIVPYDERWPEMFATEKSVLAPALGDSIVGIEHIGSTAVVGLEAKPVIDILVGVKNFDDAPELGPRVESAGYDYVPRFEDVMPNRKFFRKRKATPEQTDRQVHLVEAGGEFWIRHLMFRDWLRSDEDVRRRYVALKHKLAAKFGTDFEGYADAKTEFIRAEEALAATRGIAPSTVRGA